MPLKTSWLLLLAGPLAAQAPDPRIAQPERPSVSNNTGTVAPGHLEIESGLLYKTLHGVHAAELPLQLKLGVVRRVQLSIGVPFAAPEGAGVGPADFSAGLKLRLVERSEPLGKLAIFPALKLPTGSTGAGRGSGTTDVSLLLISSHLLGPLTVDLNAGVTRRSGDGTVAPKTASVFTAAFSGAASGPLGWVAELSAFPATGGPAGSATVLALLAGPSWRVSRTLVLDAGGSLPLSGTQPKLVYVGMTLNAGSVR